MARVFFLDKQLTIQGIHEDNANTLKEGTIFDNRRANQHIIVAYLIKSKYADSVRFTRRIFARGISLYWHKLKLDKSAGKNKLIKDNFRTLSWLDTIEVLLIMFNYVLIRKNNFSPKKI